MTELNNKKIIVTGASSGIGQEIAISLANAGALIIATGRNKSRLHHLQKSIIADGGRCSVYDLNLSNYSEIKSFINFTKKNFRVIDWIVNSAGHIAKKETLQNAELTVRVNFLAPYYLIHLLLPFLNKEGGIINISSTAALRSNPTFPVYSASKAALHVLSTALAQRPSSSPCFTICPGPTNTPMREKIAGDAASKQGPEFISRCVRKIILGKSRYQNGDIIVVRDRQEKILSRLPKKI
ncbi:MAG: SDR family oxidoreductase [bacterium]|nr:SDR family oxidoreductase [bacterium]